MDTVTIVNMKQVACYMLDGVNPVRVELDKSTNKIVYIFNKIDTIKVWDKWKAKEYPV